MRLVSCICVAVRIREFKACYVCGVAYIWMDGGDVHEL